MNKYPTVRTIWILLIAVVCLGGCSVNPATGRSQFDLLSRDQEIALGQEAMPTLIKEYGGEVAARPLREYVTEIGSRMAELTEGDAPSLPWEFTVLDSDVINAFALPGGKVFVSRGLIHHMTNEAQLAAVLGHEIGHVTAQHVDERVSRQMGAELLAEVVGATVGSDGWGRAVPYIVGTGSNAYLLHYGRSQEREADRLGIRYMTSAGYNPTGMVELLDILVRASEGGDRPPEFLSTHPNPESRRADAIELIESEYGYTISSPDYGLFPDRFSRRAEPYLSALPAAPRGTPIAARLDLGSCPHCQRSDDALQAVRPR